MSSLLMIWLACVGLKRVELNTFCAILLWLRNKSRRAKFLAKRREKLLSEVGCCKFRLLDLRLVDQPLAAIVTWWLESPPVGQLVAGASG